MGGSAYDRVTGGGQVLFSSDGGAGNTIAFTARDSATGPSGQVQYIDRSGGTGQAQQKFHGTVTCLAVSGTMAKLAGTWDRSSNGATTFQILVQDNGEGAGSDNDIVQMQNGQPNTCSHEGDDDNPSAELARGNAQVYDAP